MVPERYISNPLPFYAEFFSLFLPLYFWLYLILSSWSFLGRG